jgi:hypothetical protein
MNRTEKVYGRKIVRDSKPQTKILPKTVKGRFAMVLAIDLILGILVGICVGFLIWHKTAPTGTEDPVQITDDTKTYGTADGRVFTGEVNWVGSDAPDFSPLDVDMNEDLQEYVFNLCYCYNIDWTLVMALIEKESQYQSNVVSKTDDYGLMQINKSNFEWLTDVTGVTDFLNAKDNIRCGVFVLRKLFEKYDDPCKVLMAYNMGENGAGKLWDMGIYQTEYSQDVLTIQQRMEGDKKK